MVVACLTPTDLRPEVDDLTGAVRRDLRRSDLSAADGAALEHALRVAEAWSGWVLAVAVGPPAVEPVLADAAALGATAVLIATPGGQDRAPAVVGAADLAGRAESVAGALASVINGFGPPALVICGDRSPAHGVGAVPGFLADALGLGQALGLVSLGIAGPGHPGQLGHPGHPGRLVAERRLDGGWRERLVIDGPAVVSVEAAGVRLRRASLAAALATTDGSVRRVAPPAAGSTYPEVHYGPPRPYRPRPRRVAAPAGEPRQRLLALTGALSTRQPPRIVGPLSPAEAADELLGFLERSGYR